MAHFDRSAMYQHSKKALSEGPDVEHGSVDNTWTHNPPENLHVQLRNQAIIRKLLASSHL